MYLIVLGIINQCTRDHRCGYGHNEIKMIKKTKRESLDNCEYIFKTVNDINEMKCHVDFHDV